jgi:curved DNA-binding protein CbpA
MTLEYKPKNELPNLYGILGLGIDVCKEPNCNELIQKAYVRKAKACHPDKHPGRKDVEEVFQLLTSSYDILRDEKQRTMYNHKLSLDKQSSNDFFKLRKGTKDYMESIGDYKPANDQQKLDFKEQMRALDAKHGYDASIEKTPIPLHDATKKLSELHNIRAGQDIELKPEKLFDGGVFDPKRFNAAFDMVHKRDDGAVAPHNGVPSAWNDFGTVANYSTFDTLDNLYVDDANRLDTNRQSYSSIDFGGPMKKITRSDMNDITGADYVDGHNVLGEDYYKTMKEKLSQRKSDASLFENMKYNEFKRDDTAGYGIFDQLGLKFDDRLALDVDEDDISKKFEKLMAERQGNVLGGNVEGKVGSREKTNQNQKWR